MKKIDSLYVIDDDEIFTFLTRILIEEINIVKHIKIFSNGYHAINHMHEILNSNQATLPDVILLDVNMPVMDGWEFLDKYLLLTPRISKKITIYVVSSSISYYDVEKAKSISEVSDYLVKPITKEMFINMFNSI